MTNHDQPLNVIYLTILNYTAELDLNSKNYKENSTSFTLSEK